MQTEQPGRTPLSNLEVKSARHVITSPFGALPDAATVTGPTTHPTHAFRLERLRIDVENAYYRSLPPNTQASPMRLSILGGLDRGAFE